MAGDKPNIFDLTDLLDCQQLFFSDLVESSIATNLIVLLDLKVEDIIETTQKLDDIFSSGYNILRNKRLSCPLDVHH